MSKILVIEDEARTRNMFQDCLEAEGFQTFGAEDGLTGIGLARQHLPNLVLCDIIMPRLNGYEVLSQLRKDTTTATIPFIFVTAKIGKTFYRQGMSLGADDYLTKPSTVEELLEAVSVRLKKYEMLQKCYSAEYQPSSATIVNVDDNPSDTPGSNPNALGDNPLDTLRERKINSFFPNVSELSKIFEFIEADYNKGITLCDVAKAVGYSPAYLTNKVKRETGRTVNRWIIHRRIAEALFLLRTTDLSIDRIAMAVGYQNTCYFFRQFRQYQGTTPQAWRESQQKVG